MAALVPAARAYSKDRLFFGLLRFSHFTSERAAIDAVRDLLEHTEEHNDELSEHFIGDIDGSNCDARLGASGGARGRASQWRYARLRVHPGFLGRMGPPVPRYRAAAIGSRPGDEQVAPERREQQLRVGRRLHQSDPEAGGGGRGEEARRNRVKRSARSKPSQPVLARRGASRFWDVGMQMLQQADKITILYDFDHEVRRVRLNQAHPAQVTPSWYGDSVGHYEGDTLVIDTVGIKVGPFAMVDRFGTPHTAALHVVERYRLIDAQAAKQAQERGLKENVFLLGGGDSGLAIDPDYSGKGLQLRYTVEDEGIFTGPWSATVTYRRALGAIPENVCAENLRATYVAKDSAVPQADKPDF
jgi:hypothetical protein